ncbi:MAG: AAA family ATPase [Candidatus Methylomirabilales bacterium]
MSEPVAEGLQFKVAEAFVEDVGKGYARLDADDLKRLHAVPGDVLLITGRRSTVARAVQAPPSHCGQLLVLLDGNSRDNAQAGIDEYVSVRKVPFKVAESVLLAPVQANQPLPTQEELPHLRQLLQNLPILLGDRLQVTFLGARPQAYTVEGAAPRGALLISTDTAISFRVPEISAERAYRVSYEDIGGLDREVSLVREMVELPLKFPQLFGLLGIDPPKGVLLTGPPGTGKTLIARAVSNEVRAHFIHVNGPEVIHKFYGESEAKLRQVFEEARRNSPSIIFLDEIDALAPKRAQVVGDVEKRVVAQLLALMDGLVERGEVMVIGATNMPDLVDPALRRPGRFDREITIGVPNREGRRQILGIHSRRMPLAEDVELDEMAEITHGYVGADLAVLCKEAGMVALRRLLPHVRFNPDQKPCIEGLPVQITRADFMAAFKVVEPTATREFMAERPRITLKDVGGLAETKRTLRSILQLVRHGAAHFGHARFNPPKGILLTGPSGTGKSLLARALAGELGLTLITVDQPSLLSKWVGESEKGLREVFKRAKQASPCILFFDEIESLVPARSTQEAGSLMTRLVSQLFRELDDLHGSLGVIVLGATNRPDLMEPALLRAGRFDYVLELPLPDRDERRAILEIHAEGLPLAPEVELGRLADETEGWTGAELELICKKAALLGLERARTTAAATFEVSAAQMQEARSQVTTMRSPAGPSRRQEGR